MYRSISQLSKLCLQKQQKESINSILKIQSRQMTTTPNCVFCKIVAKELPSNILSEVKVESDIKHDDNNYSDILRMKGSLCSQTEAQLQNITTLSSLK